MTWDGIDLYYSLKEYNDIPESKGAGGVRGEGGCVFCNKEDVYHDSG